MVVYVQRLLDFSRGRNFSTLEKMEGCQTNVIIVLCMTTLYYMAIDKSFQFVCLDQEHRQFSHTKFKIFSYDFGSLCASFVYT